MAKLMASLSCDHGMFLSSLRQRSAASTPFAGMQVSAWQNRTAMIGVALLLLSLGVRYTILVQSRVMEFDQICTLLTAKAHSWHAYLSAVPADSQPPFSHVAARIGLALPVPASIGIHLVSACMTALAAVCLFRIFQQRGAPLAGLCGAAMFTSSRCVEYMFTIRPYAALMGVSALSLLVYDTYRIRRATNRSATLWPLSLVIVFAATIHALSLVYVLLPIFTGELLYWVQARRIDGRLLSAVGLASTAFIFDFTLARQIQARYMSLVPLSARTPGLPTVSKLLEVLKIPIERRWQGLLLAVVLGISIYLWRTWRARSDESHPAKTEALYPLLAALALYFAGALAFCLGALNHYFFPRYASPVFLCGALLLGGALSTAAWRRFPGFPIAVSAVLFLLPMGALRDAAHHSPGAENAELFRHGSIVASPLAFPTIWWYATPEERAHMQIVTDPDRYRTVPDGIPEVVLRQFAAAGVLPFTLTPFREYRPENDLYLVEPLISGDTWLHAALESRGYRCGPDTSIRSQAYAVVHCGRQSQ